MQRISVDPTQADFYAGYMRGLRRHHHGEQFGTVAEHELWLSLATDEDEARAAQGRGASFPLDLLVLDGYMQPTKTSTADMLVGPAWCGSVRAEK